MYYRWRRRGRLHLLSITQKLHKRPKLRTHFIEWQKLNFVNNVACSFWVLATWRHCTTPLVPYPAPKLVPYPLKLGQISVYQRPFTICVYLLPGIWSRLHNNNNIIVNNLLVVIAEQGGKHGKSTLLDCEHVSDLMWASSSLKQTPAAWPGHAWLSQWWISMHAQILWSLSIKDPQK